MCSRLTAAQARSVQGRAQPTDWVDGDGAQDSYRYGRRAVRCAPVRSALIRAGWRRRSTLGHPGPTGPGVKRGRSRTGGSLAPGLFAGTVLNYADDVDFNKMHRFVVLISGPRLARDDVHVRQKVQEHLVEHDHDSLLFSCETCAPAVVSELERIPKHRWRDAGLGFSLRDTQPATPKSARHGGGV